MLAFFQAFRFVPVVILLGVAGALLTEKGRLPLALRGLRRAMRAGEVAPAHAVSRRRRLAAFLLIVLALALAVL